VVIVQSRRADLEQLAAWMADGMRVPIDSRFPLQEVGRGLERLERGGMLGRVVVNGYG
jgi:hypothetical protein